MTKATQFQAVTRKVESQEISEHLGIDFFSPHSSLPPGFFRNMINLDLFKHGYARTRNGMYPFAAEAADTGFLNGVLWNTNDGDYAIVQCESGSQFRYLKLDGTGTFQTINDYQVSPLAISGLTDPAAMFIYGSRCFIISASGNRVVDYVGGGSFVGRNLGLSPITFQNAGIGATVGAGIPQKKTYGIELVYRRAGADYASSGISRVYTDLSTATVADTGAVLDFHIFVDPASLSYPAGISTNDTTFTEGLFVRLWASKNQLPDESDPLNIVDAQGTPDELYPVQLVTLYQLINGGGPMYAAYDFVDDKMTDAELPNFDPADTYRARTSREVITVDAMNMAPLPSGKTGFFAGNRVWVSDCAGVDPGRSRAYYSGLLATAFSESCRADDYVDVSAGNSQKTIWLGALEKDLIVIKEGETGRVLNADPANGYTVVDSTRGVTHLKLASIIQKLGVVAITNDYKLMVLGRDLVWSDFYGQHEISTKIIAFTKAMAAAPAKTAFCYVGGKLILLNSSVGCWALHVDQGQGWTAYGFNTFLPEIVVPFASGARAIGMASGSKPGEIDSASATNGYDVADVAAPTALPIVNYWITHRFQVDKGRGLVEFSEYSIVGEFSNKIIANTYVNGRLWPHLYYASAWAEFTPDPGQFGSNTDLLQAEYKMFLKDRPAANFLHFIISTTGKCTVISQQLRCFAQRGSIKPGFDPFQIFRYKRIAPPWGSRRLVHLCFDSNSDTTPDMAGRGYPYTWAAGADGTQTSIGMSPGNGSRIVGSPGSGWSNSTYDGMEFIADASSDGDNSKPVTWQVVIRFPTIGDILISHGGDGGNNYWLLGLNANGSVYFEQYTGGDLSAKYWRYTSPAGLVTANTVHTIQFVLGNGGDSGQFYVDALTAAVFGGQRRTAKSIASNNGPFTGHIVAPGADGSDLDISDYIIDIGTLSLGEAETFWKLMKAAA